MRCTFRGKPHHLLLASTCLFTSACGVNAGGGSTAQLLKSGLSPAARLVSSETASLPRTLSYADKVLEDAPTFFWRLEDPIGATFAAESISGTNPGALEGGAVLGASGALAQSGGTALSLNGSSSSLTTAIQLPAPGLFSVELWFKTSARHGGVLVSFGNSQSGASSSVDRALFIRDDGKLTFGIRSDSLHVVTSPLALNDGQWHHAVASLSSAGQELFVDGLPAASNPGTLPASLASRSFSGYWRMGYEHLASWDSVPSSDYFAGALDEIAVYSGKALTPSQVQSHYLAEQPKEGSL